jgi:hypothetical protein
MVACDHVGRKDVVGDELLALAGEVRCELVGVPTGPWPQRRGVQRPSPARGRLHRFAGALVSAGGSRDVDLVRGEEPRLGGGWPARGLPGPAVLEGGFR